MHSSTALILLHHLARNDLLHTRGASFEVSPHPMPVHLDDIRDAFIALADKCGFDRETLRFARNIALEVYVPDRLFEKLFKIVFSNEKLFPIRRSDNVEGHGGPLPTLFIGNEKTQVRQIPLSEVPPWPFKFLLELGGMIVCKPPDHKKFLDELKQYLNNYPQFKIKVDAKEWPTGEIVVFTYWFETVHRLEKRKNVNVPDKEI